MILFSFLFFLWFCFLILYSLSFLSPSLLERHYKRGMYLCNKGLAQGILSQYDDAYDSLLLSLSILREDLGYFLFLFFFSLLSFSSFFLFFLSLLLSSLR